MLLRFFVSTLLILPFVVGIGLPATLHADTVVFSNFDDTFITGNTILGDNNDNHATDSIFSAYLNSFLWGDTLIKTSDIFGAGPNQLPENAVIQSAELHVWLDHSWGSLTNAYNVYELDTDWSESTVTSNNFGRVIDNSSGIAIDSLPGPTASDYPTDTEYIFDVTSSLTRWQSGTSNFGWGLTASSARNDFFSSESGNTARRPSLVVNFIAVPEPGLAAALTFGSVFFLVRRRV